MKEHSISVIIPVMDETHSLRKTVDILMTEDESWIHELIFTIHPNRTKIESRQVIEEIRRKHPNICIIHEQVKPFAGGAISEAFYRARGTYTLLISSDLETDPTTVKEMIARMQKEDVDIVATSRWIRRGSFESYQPVKLILNYLFQAILRILFHTSLTDMTFGFRLYKTEIIQGIVWEELKHPFFLETLLKPLRLGYRVVEIPTTWKARIEGESQNTFFRNFDYLRMAWQVRFRSPESFLRSRS